MVKIRDLAQVCKSKNAGPFEITFDIVFRDLLTFKKVQESKVLSAELFAKLYKVDQDKVLFTEFEPARAFKGTIPRMISSGDVGDGDVYGAQQHALLLDVDIPID